MKYTLFISLSYSSCKGEKPITVAFFFQTPWATTIGMKIDQTTANSNLNCNSYMWYESPEGTWGFSKKAISKSLYRIVQSVLTD